MEEFIIQELPEHAALIREAFESDSMTLEKALAKVLRKAAGQELLDRQVRAAERAHEEAMKAKAAELATKLAL
jgi:hypothetical protein